MVVVDNLRPTDRTRCAKSSKRTGAALRYQPPHSPDLNPIEQTFAKLKAHLRQAKERIGQGLETFQAGAAAISKVPSKAGAPLSCSFRFITSSQAGEPNGR